MENDRGVFGADMSISVHCRSRRDLEIRDLDRFSRCFLGKSTITVLRFKLQYMKNINLDQISVIFPRLYTENPGLELYLGEENIQAGEKLSGHLFHTNLSIFRLKTFIWTEK